jgi:thioredoxin 1
MTSPNPTSITPTVVTDADFDTVVSAADVPVLVDFHADWCQPCRALAPALEALASELGDAARIVKVDIDANPELVERFDISSVPSLVFFKAGQEVERVIGNTPKSDLADRLAALA